jgi:hypothetical protein
VFSQFSTSELEVAPLRARLRVADAIDEALAVTSAPAAPELSRMRDVLRDADVAVSRDDLRRVRGLLQAADDGAALDLAGAFPAGAPAGGRRCVSD